MRHYSTQVMVQRVRIIILVLVTAIFVTGASSLQPEHEKPGRHDFHITYSRVAIEQNVIVARTRFFKDDLTRGLKKFSKAESFSLDISPVADSLFAVYYNDRFVIEVDGKRLPGRIVGSGEELEGNEQMWWYVMQYDAAAEPISVRISNTLLFDTFDDQKNVLKIQKFPSDQSSTFYFDSDETTIEITF